MKIDEADQPVGSSRYLLELTFTPNVALVSVVRRSVGSFFQFTLDDRELSGRLSTAVHELLENSVKYSSDAETTIRVELHRQHGRRVIDVTTVNRADPREIESLRELFNMMDETRDPMAFYLMLMERTTRSPRSQLGLGRVHAESGAEMSYSTDGERLTVRARLALPEEGR